MKRAVIESYDPPSQKLSGFSVYELASVGNRNAPAFPLNFWNGRRRRRRG